MFFTETLIKAASIVVREERFLISSLFQLARSYEKGWGMIHSLTHIPDGKQFTETPDEFLQALGATLKEIENADTDLVEILRTHILKAEPAENAVAQAKQAILELAIKRSTPPKMEGVDG